MKRKIVLKKEVTYKKMLHSVWTYLCSFLLISLSLFLFHSKLHFFIFNTLCITFLFCEFFSLNLQMILPKERMDAACGTLSYVAPEVLTRRIIINYPKLGCVTVQHLTFSSLIFILFLTLYPTVFPSLFIVFLCLCLSLPLYISLSLHVSLSLFLSLSPSSSSHSLHQSLSYFLSITLFPLSLPFYLSDFSFSLFISL